MYYHVYLACYHTPGRNSSKNSRFQEFANPRIHEFGFLQEFSNSQSLAIFFPSSLPIPNTLPPELHPTPRRNSIGRPTPPHLPSPPLPNSPSISRRPTPLAHCLVQKNYIPLLPVFALTSPPLSSSWHVKLHHDA